MANIPPTRSSPVGFTNFLSFTWSIDHFAEKMKMDNGKYLESEVFGFKRIPGRVDWFLRMYPNGVSQQFKGIVSTYMAMKKTSKIPFKASITISIVNGKGVKTRAKNFEIEISSNQEGLGYNVVEYNFAGFRDFIPHSLLRLFDQDLLPDDTLTFLCEIAIIENPGTRQSFKGAGVNRDVETERLHKLSVDMGKVFQTEMFTDFTVSCDGRDYKCHKSVLASRSTVFDAMFTHDMEENRRSRVDITDLEADTVYDMILYIYSGKVTELDRKAARLISAADKYDMEELKNMCEVSLSENINKENVLDLLVLSDMVHANTVRGLALKFIVYNGKEIVKQPDWRGKLKKYPEIMADMFESMTNMTELKK